MMSRNSWKSIFPVSSFATDEMSVRISSLLGSKPSARSATFSYFASIVPDPAVSNRSNACFISTFCASVSSCLYCAFRFFAFSAADFAWLCCLSPAYHSLKFKMNCALSLSLSLSLAFTLALAASQAS